MDRREGGITTLRKKNGGGCKALRVKAKGLKPGRRRGKERPTKTASKSPTRETGTLRKSYSERQRSSRTKIDSLSRQWSTQGGGKKTVGRRGPNDEEGTKMRGELEKHKGTQSQAAGGDVHLWVTIPEQSK